MKSLILKWRSSKLFKIITGDTETKTPLLLSIEERNDLIRLSSKIPNTGERILLKLGNRYFRCRELG